MGPSFSRAWGTLFVAMLLAAACSGGRQPAAPANTGDSAPGTAAEAATVQLGVTGTATATATPALPQTTPVRREGPAAVPAGTIIYYWGGGVPIEGQPQDLRRAYRLSSGELVIERLFPKLVARGPVYTFAVDAPTGTMAAGVYCGGVSWADPGSKNVLLLSDDGGFSWQEQGSLPLNSSLIGFINGGLVLTSFGPEPDSDKPRHLLYPLGTELVPPRPGAYPIVHPAGRLLWATDDEALFDSAGMGIWAAPKVAGKPERGLWNSDAGLVASGRVVSEVNQAQQAVRAVGGDAAIHFGALTRLSPDVALVNAFFSDGRSTIGRASLVNLATGALQELAELTGGPDGDAYAIGAAGQLGLARFGRVANTQSCLNVREHPALDAPVRACYPDGVLLILSGKRLEAQGITWLEVYVGGSSGWVSAEYIEQ